MAYMFLMSTNTIPRARAQNVVTTVKPFGAGTNTEGFDYGFGGLQGHRGADIFGASLTSHGINRGSGARTISLVSDFWTPQSHRGRVLEGMDALSEAFQVISEPRSKS